MKTIIAFISRLARTLILMAFIMVLIAAVVGIAGFLFTPTDTPIGHNTTRWELIRAEQREISKMPQECGTIYSYTAITKFSENIGVVLFYGPLKSFLEISPLKHIIRPNGTDYPIKELSLIDQIKFGSYVMSDSVDMVYWDMAHTGETGSKFGASKECQFPSDFVKLATLRPIMDASLFLKVSSGK